MKPEYDQLGIYVDTHEDQKLTESEKKEVSKILEEWLAEQEREVKGAAENSPSITYLEQKQKLEMKILEKLGIRDEVIELLSLSPTSTANEKQRR